MIGPPDVASTAPTFPLELQLWLSPSFPVGSFAYSHGLEWAVGDGRVRDRESAAAWLTDLITHGAARNDAILLAEAWRAARDRDDERLAAANELALALAGSRERYLETSAQGSAFARTIEAAWTSQPVQRPLRLPRGDVAYPIAVGACAAGAALPLAVTIEAFLAALVSNLVSALVRLSVIGQTDGQRVLAALVPAIGGCATTVLAATPEAIGSATFVSDIAAMAHEIQDTRLFRS